MKKDNSEDKFKPFESPDLKKQDREANKETVRKLRKYKKIIEEDEYDEYYRD